jgi:hypothetical protein
LYTLASILPPVCPSYPFSLSFSLFLWFLLSYPSSSFLLPSSFLSSFNQKIPPRPYSKTVPSPHPSINDTGKGRWQR